MEYIYAAMLLHKAGKTIDGASLMKVLEAAGVAVDEAKVKTVIAALSGVDIDKAIKDAAPVAAPAAAAPAAEKKEKPKEEEKVSEEEAAAGLGALFG
ncbi:MAG: 50S ribosomal protein P1 [archaeon]